MSPLLLVALLQAAAPPADTVAARLHVLADSAAAPGGALVVVRRGETWIVPFGTSDGTAGITEASVFRLASITKVLTAAAAARLAAEGRLSLDADIRRGRPWLERVAPGDPPVTLRQLLTHTAGFDDRTVGMFAREASQALPLGDYLQRRMPPRTSEPGREARYSNHGAALAGLVVAETFGAPFDRALDSLILRPLGMLGSSSAQPIPPALQARLARAFPCPTAACDPIPIDFRQTAPAGALLSTPRDMATFIRAVVGAPGPVLTPAARELLTARSWAARPELPGLALALQEQEVGGRRGLVHAGNSSGYSSLIVLVPDAEAGLFVVTTGGPGAVPAAALALFEGFLPPAATPRTRPPTTPLTASEAETYRGSYLLARAARRGYESFPGRFLFGHTVGSDSAGHLVRSEGGVRHRYGRVEGDLFRELDGPGMLAFERDARGAIRGLQAADVFAGARFPASYVRLPWWGAPHMMNELLSWVAGIPVLSLMAWGLGWGFATVRRRRRSTARSRTAFARAGVALAAATTAAILLFGFGFMARFNAMALNQPAALAYGMPASLARLLWLPWLILALTVLLAAAAVGAWRRNAVALGDRLLMTVVGGCSVTFVLLLVHFALLPPVG